MTLLFLLLALPSLHRRNIRRCSPVFRPFDQQTSALKHFFLFPPPYLLLFLALLLCQPQLSLCLCCSFTAGGEEGGASSLACFPRIAAPHGSNGTVVQLIFTTPLMCDSSFFKGRCRA
uniref:T. congolense-specific, cell surface-expressed gene family n=1 Tax=Trypanosoma congolense (strain IL3000) TaxID=1068625 RepID=G0USY6_TRYCI|nr:hypothetical protein, unlikely [Trypanosoma congolense IL3000]